jgi:hypothetical protein
MRSGKRAAALAGIGALVATGAAACGSAGGSHGGPAQATGVSADEGHAVQAAYTTTTKAKTAAFRLDETIQAKSSSGSPQSAVITGSGQANFATKAFTASINAPNGGTTKVLLLNGIEYLQVPAAERSQIPGHRAWLSINLNTLSQAKLGASFSQMASAGSSNPAQALSQLSAVSRGVSRIGSATVAGVPATEYRAQVSLDKAAARAQANGGAKVAQAFRQEIKALGTATLPVDVWVDAHHLVRQIRYHVPLPATGTPGGSGTATLTITFTNFGAPVRLSPPPSSQTANITKQALQRAKAGGSS